MRDLEVFHPPELPALPLRMDFMNAAPAGAWTRAAQMFVILLLTDRGSVPSDPRRGTTLLADLKSGRVYSDDLLKAAFQFAALDVFGYLKDRGWRPDGADDRLASARLVRWSAGAGFAKLWVELLSGTGRAVPYTLPVRWSQDA